MNPRNTTSTPPGQPAGRSGENVIDQRGHQLILGGLTDAHCRRAPWGNCRLQIAHSWVQREYVHWKWGVLRPLCSTTAPPREYCRPSGARECIFYTGYSRGLRPYHDLFYQPLENGRWGKRLPSNLADLLQDPLSLLVWYLDDGTLRGDCNSCRLATQGFSLEEHHQRNLLRDNFLVGSRFRWRRKRGWCVLGFGDPCTGLSHLSWPAGGFVPAGVCFHVVQVG